MEFCLRAITICDEIWIFGISPGTLTELCHAIKNKKPLRFFMDNFDAKWKEEYKKIKAQFGDPLKEFFGDV